MRLKRIRAIEPTGVLTLYTSAAHHMSTPSRRRRPDRGTPSESAGKTSPTPTCTSGGATSSHSGKEGRWRWYYRVVSIGVFRMLAPVESGHTTCLRALSLSHRNICTSASNERERSPYHTERTRVTAERAQESFGTMHARSSVRIAVLPFLAGAAVLPIATSRHCPV